jgi:hypothetical protein
MTTIVVSSGTTTISTIIPVTTKYIVEGSGTVASRARPPDPPMGPSSPHHASKDRSLPCLTV